MAAAPSTVSASRWAARRAIMRWRRAVAVVIAGGLGLRICDTLVVSGFGDRFRAKGRFET
jgi:glucokinase